MDELGVEDQVDIVSCGRCGFVFSDIPTAQEDLDKSYEEHSKYADTSLYGGEAAADEPPPPPEAPWDLERLDGVAAWLDEQLPADARLLDAGCATGSLLGFLKARGWDNLVGLDPSPVATNTARRVHGVEAVTGSFITPPPDVGQFDVVALSHVLEHLGDVRAAVSSMRALTKPGGVVYLEVPDAEHYADHLVAPFHDFNTEHINHFSLGLLERFMAAQGFEKVTSDHKIVRCSAVDPYPAIYGLWRRVDGGPTTDELGFDEALAAGIARYIDASNQLMHTIDDHLTAEIGRADGVIVWGAGQLAMKLLTSTVLARVPVVAIVDGSPQKHGLHLRGVPIVAPEKIVGSSEPIVVTSVHHEASILKACAALGGSNRLVKIPRA
ncbi:MAG: methyltransferase domain-containing protein [Actinomycetota bacterium]